MDICNLLTNCSGNHETLFGCSIIQVLFFLKKKIKEFQIDTTSSKILFILLPSLSERPTIRSPGVYSSMYNYIVSDVVLRFTRMWKQ